MPRAKKPPAAPPPVATNPLADLLHEVEAYITRYVTLPDDVSALVLALYAIATHVGTMFDAFPYLAITSDTKQSGKTRLAEVLAFLSAHSRMFAAMTDAVFFQAVKDGQTTLFIDEQEVLGSGAASQRRAILNIGYRKGQTIPRAKIGGGIQEWSVYCPKVFILIGDLTDTIRDRSIVVRMRRASVAVRFSYDIAGAEGRALNERIATAIREHAPRILDAYADLPRMDWLPDRDEELWRPLFAVCGIFDPGALPQLERMSADLAADKTSAPRRLVNLADAETAAENEAYAARLLMDLLAACGDAPHITTADALTRLYAIPTAPWRRFRGTGLTAHDIGNLLARFNGVRPRVLRTVPRSKKRKGDTARGYRRADLHAAAVAEGWTR